jgi:hypothetical protein
VQALVDTVKLLPDSKDWDELMEDEWGTLDQFLKSHGNGAGSHQEHTVGFAIIAVQKKLIPLRKAIKQGNADDLESILSG